MHDKMAFCNLTYQINSFLHVITLKKIIVPMLKFRTGTARGFAVLLLNLLIISQCCCMPPF